MLRTGAIDAYATNKGILFELADTVPGSRVLPGPIVDADGKVVGAHEGVHRFTIGQRKGLGVALGKPAFGETSLQLVEHSLGGTDGVERLPVTD